MSDIIEQIYNDMLSRNHDYSLEDKDLLRISECSIYYLKYSQFTARSFLGS